MSLTRIALRIAAVEALKGRTNVGRNVLDSPNGVLDVQADGSMRIEGDKPFISIFTDDGLAERITGRGLYENGVCLLVIEAGVSMAMTQTNDQGESVMVGISVPPSDGNFEFLLDLLQWQAVDALTDPDNAWAEIWRGLSSRVVKIEVGAKRTTTDGQRLAGHQTRIWVDLLNDPVRGMVLGADTPMGQFLAALEQSDDEDNRAHAATLRSAIGGPVEEDWRIHQRRYGMTGAELRAVGLGPIVQDLERATPPLTDVDPVVRQRATP